MSADVAPSKRLPIRLLRALLVLVAIYNLVWGIADLSRGHTFGLISLACVAALAGTLTWQTWYLRRADAERAVRLRPRPDYSAIARMEREIWGRAFEHDGGPVRKRTVSGPHGHAAPPREDAGAFETLAALRRTRVRHPDGYRGCDCGGTRRVDKKSCWRCEEQEHVERHPDTTEPAAVGQYIAWMDGYIKNGGKPTHFYGYPFPAEFRYAREPLTVDSDYEYGARGRMIVVGRNVPTERTNPFGYFGGWAHTKLYFMHGFRSNGSIIPVYSNREFDAIRERFAAYMPAAPHIVYMRNP